jgi:glycine/D-amino acid oxidase-like deaminating enzyme
MSTPAFDVLIVGAGIVGAACAFECADAGLRTGIVDGGAPGATAAAMGHVVILDDSPAQLALTRLGGARWRELAPSLPSAVAYDRPGTIWVAADDREMAEVAAKRARYEEADIPAHILDAAALAAAEPNLRPGLAGGLLVPGDAVLDPPTAAAFFLDAAVRAGATLLRGRPAVAAGAGTLTIADGTELEAGSIVVATGTDLSLAGALPIRKRKGHLMLTDRRPGVLGRQLVELGYLTGAHDATADSVAFNVQPRANGQVLVGSSRQFGVDDPEPDPQILRRMLDRACAYMPLLARLPIVRSWAGFRAAMPDNLPMIGPSSADATILFAMGFEGLGVTTAPAAGRLIADHLAGRPSAIDRTPYLPSRLDAEVRA